MSQVAKATDAGTKLIEKFEFPEDENSNLPEKTQVATDTVSVQKPSHPKWLMTAAKNAGVPSEEIESLSSDDLKEAVAVAAAANSAKAVAADVNRVIQNRDPQTGQFISGPRHDETQVQQDVQPTQKPTPPKEVTLESLGIDPTQWDDTTPASKIALDIAKGIIGHIGKDSLQARIDAIEGEFRNRAANETFDKLDQLFVSKKGIFGGDSRFDMDKSSPEFIRRQAVIDQMAKMRSANPSLPMKACFDKVTSAMFGSLDPRPEQKPDPAIAEYASGVTTQPTVRNTKPAPKGTKAAENAVQNFLAAKEERSGEPSEFDDLPD